MKNADTQAKDHAEKSEDQSKASFDSLLTANDAQCEKIEQGKNINDPFSILRINAGDRGLAGNTLHDDDFHPDFAGGTEEITGAAGDVKFFSFSRAGEHFYTHFLLTDTSSIRIKIILKDFCNFCFFKCLTCPDDQFCFFNLIKLEDKNSEHTDK